MNICFCYMSVCFIKKIVRWKSFYVSKICAKNYIENGQHVKTILQK